MLEQVIAIEALPSDAVGIRCRWSLRGILGRPPRTAGIITSPFEEASTVFGDRLAAILPDDAHSAGELREIIIGHSDRKRLLLVSFTERAGRIRIISARCATKRERRDYEEKPIP